MTVGTADITKRLRRVEGQIRGLQRMVEEERDCEAILTQLMAARAALDRVGLLILDDYVARCLQAPDGTVAQQRVGRMLDLVFSRYSVARLDESDVQADSIPPSEEE
jgi:CsoR family transcriptional regulator, copper-sensing transcriptional repressor